MTKPIPAHLIKPLSNTGGMTSDELDQGMKSILADAVGLPLTELQPILNELKITDTKINENYAHSVLCVEAYKHINGSNHQLKMLPKVLDERLEAMEVKPEIMSAMAIGISNHHATPPVVDANYDHFIRIIEETRKKEMAAELGLRTDQVSGYLYKLHISEARLEDSYAKAILYLWAHKELSLLPVNVDGLLAENQTDETKIQTFARGVAAHHTNPDIDNEDYKEFMRLVTAKARDLIAAQQQPLPTISAAEPKVPKLAKKPKAEPAVADADVTTPPTPADQIPFAIIKMGLKENALSILQAIDRNYGKNPSKKAEAENTFIQFMESAEGKAFAVAAKDASLPAQFYFEANIKAGKDNPDPMLDYPARRELLTSRIKEKGAVVFLEQYAERSPKDNTGIKWSILTTPTKEESILTALENGVPEALPAKKRESNWDKLTSFTRSDDYDRVIQLIEHDIIKPSIVFDNVRYKTLASLTDDQIALILGAERYQHITTSDKGENDGGKKITPLPIGYLTEPEFEDQRKTLFAFSQQAGFDIFKKANLDIKIATSPDETNAAKRSTLNEMAADEFLSHFTSAQTRQYIDLSPQDRKSLETLREQRPALISALLQANISIDFISTIEKAINTKHKGKSQGIFAEMQEMLEHSTLPALKFNEESLLTLLAIYHDVKAITGRPPKITVEMDDGKKKLFISNGDEMMPYKGELDYHQVINSLVGTPNTPDKNANPLSSKDIEGVSVGRAPKPRGKEFIYAQDIISSDQHIPAACIAQQFGRGEPTNLKWAPNNHFAVLQQAISAQSRKR